MDNAKFDDSTPDEIKLDLADPSANKSLLAALLEAELDRDHLRFTGDRDDDDEVAAWAHELLDSARLYEVGVEQVPL